MKNFTSLLLICFLFFSCSNELDKIRNSDDLVFLSKYVQKFTSECIDSNEENLFKKYYFNKIDTTIVFYNGLSKSNFKEKWTIPLKKINVLYNDSESMMWNEIKISGIENCIHYENRNSNENEMTNSFIIYEYNWCKKSDQEKFEISLERMIVISKK